jgi:hypothetical protein
LFLLYIELLIMGENEVRSSSSLWTPEEINTAQVFQAIVWNHWQLKSFSSIYIELRWRGDRLACCVLRSSICLQV